MKICNVNFQKLIELCANSEVQEKQTTTNKQRIQTTSLSRMCLQVGVEYQISSEVQCYYTNPNRGAKIND